MTAGSNTPVEVPALRRRASTVNSTGLNYSSSHWVDEDIKSRIRNLLLSRNECRPPRTPFSSDEHPHRLSDTNTTLSNFDFFTARSVSGSAKEGRHGLSLSQIRRNFTKSAYSNMDGSQSNRASLSAIIPPLIRTSSSADDLKVAIDGPSSPPVKKRFRLPKLVLQDIKKPEVEVKSCFEISPIIPKDDARIHEDELDCCAPCDPRDSQPSKYIVNHPTQPGGAITYEAADLACFLAGCPAGQSDCPKHPRRDSRRSTIQSDKAIQSRQSVRGQSLTPDGTNAGYRLPSDTPKLSRIATISAIAPNGNVSTGRPTMIESSQPPVPLKVLPPTGLKTPPLQSEASSISIGSFDTFPHAIQSLEQALMAKSPENFTTTITTNFTLQGSKSKHRAIAAEAPQPLEKERRGEGDDQFEASITSQVNSHNLSPAPETAQAEPSEFSKELDISFHANAAIFEPIRTKQSDASLKTKMQPPSLLSTASRRSARHVLLKPNVTEDDSIVDTGLPIPPVLSAVSSLAEKALRETPSTITLGAVVKAAPSSISNPPRTVLSIPSPEVELAQSVRPAVGRDESFRPQLPGGWISYAAPAQVLESSGEKDKPYFDGNVSVLSEPSPKSSDIPKASNEWKDVAGVVPSPVADPLTDLRKAMDLVDRVRDRNLDFHEEVRVNTTIKSAPVAELNKSGVASPKSHRLADFQSPPRVLSPPPKAPLLAVPVYQTANGISPKTTVGLGSDTSADSLNATYWGFVPQVKEAVSDAVREAVRIAVHEVVIPPRADPNEAADAYRKLVADTLTKAAQKADEALRRASLWNEATESHRESEATVLVRGKPAKSDPDWWKKDPCQIPRVASPVQSPSPVQSSVYDKDQENERRTPPELPKEERDYGDVGSLPTTFDDAQNQALSPMTPLFAGMDAIPLGEDKKPKEQATRRKPKKKTPPSYSAIPARDSSMKNVLSSKSTAKNSFTKGSNTGKMSRKRSFEKVPGKGDGTLRSVSSAGSLKSRDDLPLTPVTDSIKGLSHKNTVHWLKDLLSTQGPYETRFTALPRSHGNNPIRSYTAPVKPLTDLYLDKFPRDIPMSMPQPPQKAVQVANSKLIRLERADVSETFTKTINDLELLMNEALSIARQAADSQEPARVPSVLGRAVNLLKGRRKMSPSESRLLAGRSSDVSDHLSVHESLRYSGSSDYTYESDVSEVAIRSIVVPAKNRERHDSGWPQTGRASTPFPPASMPPSNEVSNERLDKIKIIDPRSKPTENTVEAPHRKMTAMAPNIPNLAGEGDTVLLQIEERPIGFVNLEPFNRATTEGRKQSDRQSPKSLSPKKQSQVDDLNALNTPYEAISEGTAEPQSFCGQPVGHPLPRPGREPSAYKNCVKGHSENDHQAVSARLASKPVSNRREVRSHISEHHTPPIQPRDSSRNLEKRAATQTQRPPNSRGLTLRTGFSVKSGEIGKSYDWQNVEYAKMQPCSQVEAAASINRLTELQIDHSRGGTHSLDGSMATKSEEMDFDHAYGHGVRHRGGAGQPSGSRGAIELRDVPDSNLPVIERDSGSKGFSKHFNLTGKRHVSLKEHHLKGFSLTKSHKRQAIARDWSPGRKRFVATVACLSTALIGIVAGIYAGVTPAVQYYIVDFHHYTVLGNVFFFIGLAIPTFLFWPLPLLHGRKPYILGAMSLAMPLLFPQALAVGSFRSPYVSTYRVGLLVSRALMGFCLGFANINFKGMLTDLFGASLQSTHPHQEHVDEFDVRRHGGGMGMWLGLWTWSALGSLGLGFLIGASIINTLPPAWGFYVSIIIIAFIMLLNVICPEVRRSAFRRSVAEVVTDNAVSRRLARGEVKMHMVQSGPKWWGEEFHYGVQLSQKMIRQPGFMIMALYVAWIYGQQVLIIVLLGALVSKDYNFKSPMVGLSVMAIPLGALVAIPFQKAGLFSRSRVHAPTTDDGTFKKKLQVSSHMVRRTIFVLCLPITGLLYTVSAGGPPTPFIFPIIFAGLIGFLSNLAMAECHGIIMETFDTSDLQPGMTGRPRGSSGDKTAAKRTNYSSFPRVMSAFAITQGLGYCFAAAASGVGGVLTRHLGQQAATGVMAGVLLILSLMLLGTLIRFTEVQIIPDSKKAEMDHYHQQRRASRMRNEEGETDEEPWRPIIIGNPHHTTRRMNLLELGSLSRFSDIRIKNRLVDERHLNRQAIETLEAAVKDQHQQNVKRRSRRSFTWRPQGDVWLGKRIGKADSPESKEQSGRATDYGDGGPRPLTVNAVKNVTWADVDEKLTLLAEMRKDSLWSESKSKWCAGMTLWVLDGVWRWAGARDGIQEQREFGEGFEGWYWRSSVHTSRATTWAV